MQFDGLNRVQPYRIRPKVEQKQTFGVMLNMSSVRSVESLRSRSVIGMESVWVDARLSEVASDSREERSLHDSPSGGGWREYHSAYPPDALPLFELVSLPVLPSVSRGRKGAFFDTGGLKE